MGVALVGAAVIIANPVVVPPADIRIPAPSLAAGSRVDVLDPEFLAGIGAAAPDSTNPTAVVQQLVADLCLDATDVGQATVASAFAAGVVAANEPTLLLGRSNSGATVDFPNAVYSTVLAATAPLGPPLLLVDALRTVIDEHLSELTSLLPVDPSDVGVAPSATALNPTVADPAPVLERLFANLSKDTTELGGATVAAAFTAGAVAVAEPTRILGTLTAAASSDVPGALYGGVLAATAPLDPPALVANAVRTVIEKRFAELTSVDPAATPEAGAGENAPPDGAGQDESTATTPETLTLPGAGDPLPAEGPDVAAEPGAAESGPSEPAEDLEGEDPKSASPNGATDLTDGNKHVPETNKTSDPARDAVNAIEEQVRSSIERLRETLRRLTGQDEQGETSTPDDTSGATSSGG